MIKELLWNNVIIIHYIIAAGMFIFLLCYKPGIKQFAKAYIGKSICWSAVMTAIFYFHTDLSVVALVIQAVPLLFINYNLSALIDKLCGGYYEN